MSKDSRNPYIDSDVVPRMKRSVVGFVDILGYKKLTKSAETEKSSQDLLIRLHKALHVSREHIDPSRLDSVVMKFRKKDFSAFRSFTDNVVIGRPIHDDGEVELGNIINDVSYFQMRMAMEGFFVRGAIAIGDLYMDDIAVFGPGLIEAYEAESTLARDPRIVLAPSARSAVDDYLKYYARSSFAPQNRELLRDSDTRYFVNYLDTLIAENGFFYEEELAKHKESIEEKLNFFKANPNIWTKYFWVANYHNYFCSQHSFINENLKIDMQSFQLMPARLVV